MNNKFDFDKTTQDWNSIEATVLNEVVSNEKADQAILRTSDGEIFLSILENGIRLSTTAAPDNSYGMLVRDPSAAKLSVDSLNRTVEDVGRNYTVELGDDPISIDVRNEVVGKYRPPLDRHFERRFRIPPLARFENGWLVSRDLRNDERVYGCGEKWSALNHRGSLIDSYNRDALGVNTEYSYKNSSFTWSTAGVGQFFCTPGRVVQAIGFPNWSHRSQISFVEGDELDLFVLFGSNCSDNPGEELIKKFTELTGRAPIPPKWSAGVILSRAYYKDSEEILETAKRVREEGMPCDVISFDGRAWQDTDTRFTFEWCSERYPEPKKVIDELKSMDFRICVWEYPLVSVKNERFEEFEDSGWFLEDSRTGKAFRFSWEREAFGEVLTPLPDSGIIDFTNPEAYEFWRDSHQELFELGVDMVKADFGEQLNSEYMIATNGATGVGLHNAYALLYNKCVFEAAEKYAPNGPFLFSRSGWIGSQRYNSQWGGDPQADWGGMAANIRGGLSWGLSGAPFYATDVGGFYGDERNPELYIRWAQNAVFSAHYRLHGIGPREPWSYGEEAARCAMAAFRLRYALIPYIQKAFRQSHETGLPVQRPMVLAFPEQPETWSFEDQFMFGDDIFVAPILESGGAAKFYLPKGDWVGFDPTGELSPTKFKGDRFYNLHCDPDEFAAFVREGTEIELARPVTFVSSEEELETYVWKAI